MVTIDNNREFLYDNVDIDSLPAETRVMYEQLLTDSREDYPCKDCKDTSCIFTGCDTKFFWWDKAVKEETAKWREEYKKRHNKTE